jgi:hypothetical protein
MMSLTTQVGRRRANVPAPAREASPMQSKPYKAAV